jgi:hypothetical protein
MRKALVLAMVLVSPAQAATVRVEGHRVLYAAEAGEKNVVSATYGVDDVTFLDKSAALTAGDGCTQKDEDTTSCPAAALVITLGDGNDHATVWCDDEALCGPAKMVGGPGDDNLTGTERTDVLIGGAGSDNLSAGGGRDVLRGGPGVDIFQAYAGLYDSDLPRISCGSGNDWLLPGAVIGLDCETILRGFNGYTSRMRARGDRLTFAIHYARCRYELRFGDRSPWHATTLHPAGWSRVTLRMPRSGGPLPHLYWREACAPSDDPGLLLFRVRNPFWERPG